MIIHVNEDYYTLKLVMNYNKWSRMLNFKTQSTDEAEIERKYLRIESSFAFVSTGSIYFSRI